MSVTPADKLSFVRIAALAALTLPACTLPADTSGLAFETQIRRAFELHQKQDYPAAIPILQQGYKQRPHDYFVNLLLGIDLLRTGQREESIPFLKEAARLHPKEDIPWGYLGEAHAGLHQYADAALAYIQAIRMSPQSSDAAVAFADFSVTRFAQLSEQLRSTRRGLAAEYRLRAMALPPDSPQRRENLERSVSLDPNAPTIWSDLALAYLSTGSPTAEADLVEARLHNPDDLHAWLAEALQAANTGDWRTASTKLNAIAHRSPKGLAAFLPEWPSTLQPRIGDKIVQGPAIVFIACAAKTTSRCKESLLLQIPSAEAPPDRTPATLFQEQRWEALLSAPRPANAATWFYHGAALALTNQCKAAIPALERGLTNTATSVDAGFLLSRCYATQAGTIAENLAQNRANDASVHMMRGNVFLHLQANSAGAIVEFQAALKASPDDPAAWESAAEAQMAASQTDAARVSALRALQIDAHRQGAVRTLAKLAMQDRDYATALPYLLQLLAKEPDDPSTRVELATACAHTGEMEEALRNLQPVLVQGYPDEKGNLHYLLGTVLKKLGREPEAEQAFKTATELSDAYQQSSHRDSDEKK
jgi:tetratricopeptide (TPR) repeat protein